MKKTTVLLLLIVLVSFTCKNQGPPIDRTNKYASLLPENGAKVDVYVITTTKEINDISIRFKASIQQQQDWWLEYTEKQIKEDGGPLPYHENMGITEDEYEKIKEAHKYMELEKVGEGRMHLLTNENGEIVLNGDGKARHLKEGAINLDKGSATCPYGPLGSPNEVDATSEEGIIKPWKGFFWRNGEFDKEKMDLTDLRLGFGKIVDEPRGVMNYKVKVAEDNQLIQNFDLFLKYDLK